MKKKRRPSFGLTLILALKEILRYEKAMAKRRKGGQ